MRWRLGTDVQMSLRELRFAVEHTEEYIPHEPEPSRVFSGWLADSDEVARAFRDDVARYSDMMSPGVWCLAGG